MPYRSPVANPATTQPQMSFQPMAIRPPLMHINTSIKPSHNNSLPSKPPIIQTKSISAIPLALADQATYSSANSFIDHRVR